MLSNIFSLILVLLLIGVGAGNSAPPFFEETPLESLAITLLLYGVVLAILYGSCLLGKRLIRRHPSMLAAMTSITAIAFFICYYFVFGAQRAFETCCFFPVLLSSLLSILLYLGFVAVSEYASKAGSRDAFHHTLIQVSFLAPFTIPFLLFIALNDLLIELPLKSLNLFYPAAEEIAVYVLNAFLMVVVLIFLPCLIVFFWRCRNLPIDIEERLEGLCKKTHFKHQGLKILGVKQHALTAAIMGISARFRYILFSPALLDRLSPHAIEAVLAHEIGHSQRKHLLLYPLLILGMALITGVLFNIVQGASVDVLRTYSASLHPAWREMVSLILFYGFYILILGILLRFVFGYFMRLFERQADLHVFVLGLPAQYMIDALDEIAICSGYTHNVPCWHHHSIQERIDFLRSVQQDPSLIHKHNQKTYISLWSFFTVAAILFLLF